MYHSKVAKILVVHPALTPGGTTRVAIDDATSLGRQNFIIGFASDSGPFEDELKAEGISFHRLFFVDPERHSKVVRYMLGLPLSTILLLHYVLRNRYDCLYVQHRQSGIPSAIISWVTGVRYVFVSHSELGRLNRGRLFTPLGHHIIAVSEQVKRNIITYWRVPGRMITVIPNATKTDVVKADRRSLHGFDEKWSILPESQVVACVAMLVKVKGHNTLLSAWKRVLVNFPEAVLILAGDGPLRHRLQDLSDQLGITDRVRFLGYVRDLSIVYSRASIVVLSSISEGLPISILDAFSHSVPVVATAVSGTSEIVIDGKTGLLVGAGNIEQLAQALMSLLSDAKARKEMGQAGRKLVIERYSSEVRELDLGNYIRILEKGCWYGDGNLA